MNQDATTPPLWWELHLRQARGQPLSAAEQQFYDAEMARLDQEETPLGDTSSLRALRANIGALAQENAELRQRLDQLAAEVRAIEQALSQRTRQLLGVQE
jgi:hypothetical protein